MMRLPWLNKSLGSWGFAGKQLRDGKELEFEAVLQVQGGVSKDQISLGSMPMWQITIQWPVKEPKQTWHMTLVPGFNPDGVEWLLFSAPSVDGETKATGEKQFFKGAWDPASRTLTWTPKAPFVPGAASGQDQEAKGREFQMIISENGGLQIKNFQQDDSPQISGQSVVRLGEYVKPGTDLKILKMLPNGYKMFFASSSEVLLVDKENGGVAGARVDKIGCSGELIFGLITQRERIEKPEDTLGYFWLDSATGEITKGMELGAWRDALKAKGVEEPVLLAPERVGPRS